MTVTPGSNFYINNFNQSQEQNLIEDLVIESIKFYGLDLWYLPKRYVNLDQIYTEDNQETFDQALQTVMYVKGVNGFEGEGDFLAKFGAEIRDSIVVSFARRTFLQEVGAYALIERPREGDLIYLPLNDKVFEIMFVEHEPVFYQMGSLQFYDLTLELFEYSNQDFKTGLSFIDDRMNVLSLDRWDKHAFLTEDGYLLEMDDPNRAYGDIIIDESFDGTVDTQITDAENVEFQTEGDAILDFSEKDPFSEGGTY